jgi:hypothetical protein
LERVGGKEKEMSTKEKFFDVLKSGRVINYCYSYDSYYKKWTAYLMAEGAEQEMASYEFDSKEEITALYESHGIKYYFPI